jgi:hypothetical protein
MSPFGQNEIDPSSSDRGGCFHSLLRSSFKHTSRNVDCAVYMFQLCLRAGLTSHILFINSYLQVRLLLPRPRKKAGEEGSLVNKGCADFTHRALRGVGRIRPHQAPSMPPLKTQYMYMKYIMSMGKRTSWYLHRQNSGSGKRST